VTDSKGLILSSATVFACHIAVSVTRARYCYGKSSVCDVEVSWSHRLE